MAEFSERNFLNKECHSTNQNEECYQLISMSKENLRPIEINMSNAGNEECSSSSQKSDVPSATNFRKKSIIFLNSLKNTTLSASRILKKQNLSVEEKLGSKKPVDLEAHILFQGSEKRRRKKKFLRDFAASRNESDSGDDMYPVKVLTPNEDFSNDEEDDDEIEDDTYLATNNIITNLKEANLSIYEDEEEYDYNEESLSGNQIEFTNKNSNFVSGDKTDTLYNMQDSSKINKNVCLKIAESETDDENFILSKSDDDGQATELTQKSNCSNYVTNKLTPNQDSGTIGMSVCSAKLIEKTCQSLSTQDLENNYPKSTSDQRYPSLVEPESKSRFNLKLPMAPPIIKSNPSFKLPHNSVGSRQSVSFSPNTSFKNKLVPGSYTDNDTSSNEKFTYQRNLSMPGTKRKESFCENQSMSEPCRSALTENLEKDYSTTGLLEDNKINSHLSPYLYSASNSTSHLLSHTSIFSHNNSTLNISLDSTLPSHNNPPRLLQKSMTTGSKAMRIMGNNNTMSSTETTSKLSVSSKGSSISSTALKKQQQRRLFFKNGNINISRSNINKRRRRYLTDIFTTLIDLKWRYNIGVFSLGFLISWIGFACAWYTISYIHGDLAIQNPSPDHVKCIANLHSFVSAILFSIETQQTIGYGARFTTEKCPEAVFVMMVQSSVGVMIQSFMVGVVFAKLSRPKKRSETLMFSKNAVISLRDGRLCLICRVGDMRKSHIVEAHVRMYLIKKKVTQEGEILPLHMYDLNVGWATGADRLFLVWPLTIEHYIDQDSPFWNISADDLRKERFELVVILEGIVESTGMTTQARSSYLTNEILWGHRFEKLITFQKEDGAYKIDYSRFNMTIPIDTPTCSAKDLHDLKEQEQEQFHSQNEHGEYSSHFQSNRRNISENYQNDLRKRRIEAELDASKQPKQQQLSENADVPEIVISNNTELISSTSSDLNKINSL